MEREEPKLEQVCWQGLCPHGGPTLEQPVPEGLAPCGKDSRWRSLCRTVSCERDLMLEQGKSVSSHPSEEEGAAEVTCDELTVTPIPHPPVLLRGRR